VKNKEVLHRVKEERNILHKIKRRKANWIGNILRRNCLLLHATEGKMGGGVCVCVCVCVCVKKTRKRT
jgi:hypothetical protein